MPSLYFKNLLVVALINLLLVLGLQLQGQEYDVIIRGGTVIDGSGSPGVLANVALKGQRIAAISQQPIKSPGAKFIDATGLVIAPDFIDMHAHLDPITQLPEARSMVSQGVTTAIGGPDGTAPWPTVPVVAQKAMVVTSQRIATEVSLEVLKNGGNAVDAAVSAAFALAVCQPRSGNIGGGGFMLVSLAGSDEVISIDYREKAPEKAAEDMFLDSGGKVDEDKSRYSHASAGVPGTVYGLAMALEKYGTVSLAQAMAPAIKLAGEGFAVTSDFSSGIKAYEGRLSKWPSSRKVFFKPDGGFYEPGDIFVQQALGETLKAIAENGVSGFYEGKVAALIVSQMQKSGGLITLSDLKNYRPVIRKPIHGTYRGYDIYSMAPPSSGGIHLIQILNILENFPIKEYGHNSTKTIHLMAEAMKRAYADRAQHLGDSDFVRVPVNGLTDKDYAKKLAAEIDLNQATPSQDILFGNPVDYESDDTTHFSVVDAFGNAVSNTYTINLNFGSGIVVEGAGFLLNNEMDDFSAKPGAPNAFGLLGSRANKIEPNKRMLSSMTPTIVKRGGKNVLVTGSPGGSKIITTTLGVIMNVIDHGLNVQLAVNAPRIHHQWSPDELRIERGIDTDTTRLLKEMGHNVVEVKTMGAANSIFITDNQQRQGASDPRRINSSAMGF